MVQFHRHDAVRPFTEVAGQGAEPGADFEDRGALRDPGGIGDAREHRIIRKEVLSQPLMRAEVVFCEKFLRRSRSYHCSTHTISAGTGVRK